MRRLHPVAWVALALFLVAAPRAEAQSRVARVGYLGTTPTTPDTAHIWDAFVGQLRGRGWIEGQNLVFERRYAEGRTDRLPALAGELVRLHVDVIVAIGTPHARAAKEATSTIPIVTVLVGDPLGSGLVASLARAGGNVTGMSSMGGGIVTKQLQLLLEAVPGASRVAFLWNPGVPLNLTVMRELEAAAGKVAVQLRPLEIRQPEDLDKAFAAVARDRPDALLPFDTIGIFTHRRRVAELAARHRLPTMFLWKAYADAGGLMAYGPSLPELFRGAAVYVDKILRGARPADLPIEEPTAYELVINLKTAKTLGLTIPQSLMLRAAQVIE
jgi:putative ABC transport system substrate-binding protein